MEIKLPCSKLFDCEIRILSIQFNGDKRKYIVSTFKFDVSLSYLEKEVLFYQASCIIFCNDVQLYNNDDDYDYKL